MEKQHLEPKQDRKPYVAPTVVYEAPLEVRAGTVQGGIPNLLEQFENLTR